MHCTAPATVEQILRERSYTWIPHHRKWYSPQQSGHRLRLNMPEGAGRGRPHHGNKWPMAFLTLILYIDKTQTQPALSSPAHTHHVAKVATKLSQFYAIANTHMALNTHM